MRKNFLLVIAAALIAVVPLAKAQQNAAEPFKQHAQANENEVKGKANEEANKIASDEKRKQAVKNRRDHRRAVNHRLRRRA